MNRKVIGVVASVAIAGAGTVLLFNFVNSSAQKNTPVAVETQAVLRVKAPVAKGTPIDKLVIGENVEIAQVAVADKIPDAASDLSQLGGVAAQDLVPGEQILRTRFAPLQEVAKSDAGSANGLIGVWVSLDPIRALAGKVKVGDQVTVYGLFAGATSNDPTAPVAGPTVHILMNKVPVLDVIGTIPTQAAPAEGGDPAAQPAPAAAAAGQIQVKLGLDAPASERLVFAVNNGSVWLGDEADDVIEGGTKIVSQSNIYDPTAPQIPTAPQAPALGDVPATNEAVDTSLTAPAAPAKTDATGTPANAPVTQPVTAPTVPAVGGAIQ